MLVKPIANCRVCDTPFPYRKNKLYCSNTCKQKAYNNSSDDQLEIGLPVYLDNQFSLSEYEKYTSMAGQIPLIYYLFLRRNVKREASVEEISIYINGLYADMNFEENLVRSEPYKQFEHDFFNNKYNLIS